MFRRNTEFFLFDIFVPIQKIKKVVQNFKTPEELLYSFTDWDSVIREFEIMGEATKFLIKDELLPQEFQIIVDFRNQISHKYFGIEPEIVWNIAQHDLPRFENLVIEEIHNIEPSLKEELINSFVQDNIYLNFVVHSLKGLQ